MVRDVSMPPMPSSLPVPGDTSDAVDRETAWLRSIQNGIPPLLAPAGPWQVIEAYWPRPVQAKAAGIYVLRDRLTEQRFANIRRIDLYAFQLRLIWPVRPASGIVQEEQRAFDKAVSLIGFRVRGLLLDKTHGGRFLAVGEAPAADHFSVDFHDPEKTLGDGYLYGEFSYAAVDPDFDA